MARYGVKYHILAKEPLVREIPLTQGKVAIVDDEDYERVILFKWQYHHDPKLQNGGYAVHAVSKMRGRGTLHMHRLILRAEGGQRVDHRNGNGLDNRRSNLRLATPSQNGANTAKYRGLHTSRYKGVFWYPRYSKWRAQIRVRGVQRNLGYHVIEADAACAYNAAAREAFGEYAALNAVRLEAPR